MAQRRARPQARAAAGSRSRLPRCAALGAARLMRVGLVTGEYPPMQGGVGDFTRQLGQALARLGVETHVVTSRRAAASGPAGVSVYPVINHWSFVSLWRMRAPAPPPELDPPHPQYPAPAP